MREFRQMKVPLSVNLIIGDNDFLTYYLPFMDGLEIDFDLEGYVANARKYKKSVCDELRRLSVRNSNLFTVLDFDENLITSDNFSPATNGNSVNVISLALNADCFTSDDQGDFCVGDINEETFRTKRRRNNPGRYDPIFAGKDQVVYEKASRIKFNNYALQGEFVRTFSRILLVDELPPSLKARMYGQKVSDFVYLFPWIRREDKWRNPRSL
jgi:hypothetical protein